MCLSIWVKMNYPRVKPGNIEPKNFYFVKRNQNPEYSIRRVGVNAGKIDQNCEKSVQSHYFIRFFDLPTCKKESVVKELENCVFTECRDTVRAKIYLKTRIKSRKSMDLLSGYNSSGGSYIGYSIYYLLHIEYKKYIKVAMLIIFSIGKIFFQKNGQIFVHFSLFFPNLKKL